MPARTPTRVPRSQARMRSRASSLFGSWLAQGEVEPRSGSGRYRTSIDGDVRLVALADADLYTKAAERKLMSAASMQFLLQGISKSVPLSGPETDGGRR